MPITGYTPPPPQYDIIPSIPVIEQVLSLEDVHKLCLGLLGGSGLQKGQVYLGCASVRFRNSTKVCLVWRINDERVKRHEWGHCSGWPAGHPMGSIVELTQESKSVPLVPIHHSFAPTLPWPDK